MTVSATPRKAGPFAGTGAQTAFPFTFKIFATTDVVVTTVVTATSVQATPVNGTDYTVAMNGDQEAAPGGTVNMVVAPAVGVSLVVSSAVPSTQSVAVTNNGGFFPAVFNAEFDKLTVLIQQLEEKATRTLSSPITAAGVSGSVSPVANAVLVWDGTGQNILSIPQTTLAASFVYNNATYQAALVTSLAAVPADMIPDADATRSVGSSAKRWLNLFLSGVLSWGSTNAAVMIKRAGIVLSVRLGDDSGDAALTASTFTASVGFVLGVLGSLKASADGVFQLLNNAGTAFTRLAFGGTTNAFPALKRSAAALAVVLADDSGDATLTAKTQAAGDASTNVATTAFANSLQGFRNRLINGDMRIDQRRAGASVTPTAGAYITDRWSYDPSQASKMTLGQNLNAVALPAGQGFVKYLGAQTASAYAPAAGESFALRQTIEGQNISDLMWGTASAKAITVTFLAYSSLTGTFGGCVRNGANARSYPFTYAIAAANTWTAVSVTIPGDTAGVWSTDNTAGIHLFFGLGVGATLSGAAGAWAGASYVSATGAVSVVSTLNATFYVTGVQLEPGSQASPFERRPLAAELALCQRYFETNVDIGTAPADGVAIELYNGITYQTNGVGSAIRFKVPKRATPTMSLYRGNANSTAGQAGVLTAGAWGNGSATTPNQVETGGFTLQSTFTIANASAVIMAATWTADAEL